METLTTSYRKICYQCLRPQQNCYCHLINKIKTPIKFVILIHPIERKRKIATGRMAHLCLPNSILLVGSDFTHNQKANRLINDPKNYPLTLYPGDNAINLSEQDKKNSTPSFFPPNKTPVIFVIDGTWSTARKTMKTSKNLKQLQSICFTPTTPSQFRVRKQPNKLCYSTIEAIHKVLDLTDTSHTHKNKKKYDVLLDVFTHMVETQIKYINKPK
jgi:DTW domain-containing protein YfiP